MRPLGIVQVSNGGLLRRDIHSVFDAGDVTINEQHRFVVSERVTDFDNGNEYRRLHGTALTLPTLQISRPSRDALHWHNENILALFAQIGELS